MISANTLNCTVMFQCPDLSAMVLLIHVHVLLCGRKFLPTCQIVQNLKKKRAIGRFKPKALEMYMIAIYIVILPSSGTIFVLSGLGICQRMFTKPLYLK